MSDAELAALEQRMITVPTALALEAPASDAGELPDGDDADNGSAVKGLEA